ncbi:hypothetical protein NUW58_g1850 [Xylaria curta]|uniref:Uncharacterized protein n=1 Tax=Xylaria curta TaxID=42375 RepID=A0ACC1PJJ5_9PEZI|nr:hypothetical protein NUW58_g1850 [Xylaria curta]
MATHVKFTVTHYRRPEHTHEAFMKWIVEEHLPLAIPVLKRHGVLNYSLFTTPADLNAALRANMGGHRSGWDVADFDCFIEYTLEDVKNIAEILSDPDWAKSVEHQDDWVDTSRALMSVGYITPYLLESGEVVNVPNM